MVKKERDFRTSGIMTLYELMIKDDSGVFTIRDDDLEYIKSEKRRRENMGCHCSIKKYGAPPTSTLEQQQ